LKKTSGKIGKKKTKRRKTGKHSSSELLIPEEQMS
jgi:hypothetical protein